MTSDIVLSLFVAFVAICSFTNALDEQVAHLKGDAIDLALLRRSQDDSIGQEFYSRELVCRMDMVGITGEYLYTSRPENAHTVCATYLLAESNDAVEIEFTEFDIDCEDPGNQIQFFDGWTMGVGSFPSVNDHPLPLAERVIDVCSRQRRVFRSHQNGAMITFKLASPTASFTIVYRPVHIPQPCNVIAPEPSGMHTIRNYGNERNCSLSIVYPASVRIMSMGVGESDHGDAKLRCSEGLDYIELLEGNSIDLDYMTSEESICGHVGNEQNGGERAGGNLIIPREMNCHAGHISVPLMCHNSVVRLVSSGQHDNRVSFRFDRLNLARSKCPENMGV